MRCDIPQTLIWISCEAANIVVIRSEKDAKMRVSIML